MSEGPTPWHHVGNRIGGNPFAGYGIFGGDPGENWCTHCKLAVTTDTKWTHRSGVFTYLVLCERCGQPLLKGVVPDLPLIGDTSGLSPKAVDWFRNPPTGRDRT